MTLFLPVAAIAAKARSICNSLTATVRVEDRGLRVDHLGVIAQRAQILRQARAAKGEARLHISRRNVEPLIGAENFHDLVAVDARRLADRAHLVGETDLERVPDIVGVFDRRGGAAIDDETGGAVIRVEDFERVGGTRVHRANDRDLRIAKILDGGAFAQEFGVIAEAEILARLLAGMFAQHRNDVFLHHARQDRRAHHDHVLVALGPQRLADIGGDLKHVFEIEAAVRQARRADADEAELGVRRSPVHVGGGGEPSRSRPRARSVRPNRARRSAIGPH